MDLEQLLELQDLDTRISQLRHRLANDPTRAALASAEADVVRIDKDMVVLFGERDKIRQELKRLEDEAAMTQDKIVRTEKQLYGGTVKAHKDLEALQHEVETLKDRLGGFEDHELEQMELAEPLDARAAELDAAKGAAEGAVEQRRGEVTVMEAEVGVELESVIEARASLAEAIPDDLIKQYDRYGAARLAAGGRCEGCHLQIPSAEYADLKRAPADEVHLCPECSRILVR